MKICPNCQREMEDFASVCPHCGYSFSSNPAQQPPAVYPAVPKNKARLRFCVISEHRPEQIIQALDLLVETAAELRIELPPTDGKPNAAPCA